MWWPSASARASCAPTPQPWRRSPAGRHWSATGGSQRRDCPVIIAHRGVRFSRRFRTRGRKAVLASAPLDVGDGILNDHQPAAGSREESSCDCAALPLTIGTAFREKSRMSAPPSGGGTPIENRRQLIEY